MSELKVGRPRRREGVRTVTTWRVRTPEDLDKRAKAQATKEHLPLSALDECLPAAVRRLTPTPTPGPASDPAVARGRNGQVQQRAVRALQDDPWNRTVQLMLKATSARSDGAMMMCYLALSLCKRAATVLRPSPVSTRYAAHACCTFSDDSRQAIRAGTNPVAASSLCFNSSPNRSGPSIVSCFSFWEFPGCTPFPLIQGEPVADRKRG